MMAEKAKPTTITSFHLCTPYTNTAIKADSYVFNATSAETKSA